jgi:Tol biopolymer transport system component
VRYLALLVLGLVTVLVLAGQLARAASSTKLPIVASQDWWPVWSPDARYVAFTRVSGRTMTLEVLDVSAHRTFRIAANHGQLSPSWANSGRIAFSLGGRIYSANPDGSNRLQITSSGHSYAPAWRPVSSDLAYLTTVGARNTDLWVNGALWARDAIGVPAWAPDVSRLAFQRDAGIYVATGPGAERRVTAAANPGQPAWSPDGTRIAYTAGRRIWVVLADGSAAPTALSPVFPSISPLSWTRQGDALAYTTGREAELTFLDGHTSQLIADRGGVGAAMSPTSDIAAFSGPRRGCPDHEAIRIYYDNAFNGSVSGSCEIRGTSGNDVVDGTGAGGDVIVAGAGNDLVHARTATAT